MMGMLVDIVATGGGGGTTAITVRIPVARRTAATRQRFRRGEREWGVCGFGEHSPRDPISLWFGDITAIATLSCPESLHRDSIIYIHENVGMNKSSLWRA